MNSRAAEAYLKAQRDKSVTYQSLEVGFTPFNGGGVIAANAKVVELFVPQQWFTANPRKWSDLSRTRPHLRTAVLRLVELFNHWSKEIGNRVRATSESRFIPYQVVTFEQVNKKGNETVAGWRLRITGQAGTQTDTDVGSNVAAITGNLIDSNEANAIKEQKKRSRKYNEVRDALMGDSALEFINALNMEEYVRLCQIYTGEMHDMDMMMGLPLGDPNNPVHPYKVFSLANSWRLARNAGAQESQCSLDSYRDVNAYDARAIDDPIEYDESNGEPIQHAGYTWPHPELVWRMKPCNMYVGATTRVYWPMVEPLKAESQLAVETYIENTYGKNATEQERANAKYLFSNCISRSAIVDTEPEDFDTLKAKHHQAAQFIKTTISDPVQQKNELMLLKQKSLNEFASLFSPEGESTPDAIKALARWLNDYVGTHKSLCMEMPKLTENLTAFGDEMVMLGITLETLFGVNTQHTRVLALFFKQLFVYRSKGFNPHSCFAGPGKAGKSFALLLCMLMLVPGSFINSTYSSTKANVVPGNQFQYMLRFYEDVMPIMLGILNKEKGGDTANTDIESIMKAMMTSGILNALVLDTSNGRAAATTADIRAKVNTVINVCTNASSRQIPEALASRFHKEAFQLKDRVEGGGITTKATNKPSPEVVMMQETLVMRLRRNQVMTSIIFLLIHCEILPDIDMSAAHIVLHQTVEEARKAGLSGVECTRNFERLDMICQTLVVWDSISTLWDSPTSPFVGHAHDITHFLYAERYLRATVEHATFALGLMSDQYEDAITNSILADLMDTHYKPIRDRERAEKKKQQEEEKARSSVGTKNKKKNNKKPLTADLDYTTETSSSSSKHTSIKKKTNMRQQTIDEMNSRDSQDGGGEGQQQQNGTAATNGDGTYDPLSVDDRDPDYYSCPFNPTGRSFAMHSDTDRIRYLAVVQLPTMKEKPLLDDVVAAYEGLLHRLVPAAAKADKDKDKDGSIAAPSSTSAASISVKLIPALKFGDNRMYLSKAVVRGNKENALRECLRKVVDHRYAKDGEYVYGMHREHCPFLFDTIKTGSQMTEGSNLAEQERKQREKKELKVMNPEYYHPKYVSITHRYLRGTLRGLHSGGSELASRQLEEQLSMMKRRMRTASRSKYRLLVDVDLNDYAEQLHLLKLDTELVDILPSGDPWEYAAQLRKVSTDRLINYPYEMPHYMPIKYINDQKEEFNREKETKYSMRAHIAEKQSSSSSSASSNSSSSSNAEEEETSTTFKCDPLEKDDEECVGTAESGDDEEEEEEEEEQQVDDEEEVDDAVVNENENEDAMQEEEEEHGEESNDNVVHDDVDYEKTCDGYNQSNEHVISS